MQTHLHLDSIDSTNSFAKRELARLRDSSTFIIAREQTGGRGRLGNSWVSPKDQNLYLTLAEPIRSPLLLLHYSFAAALAVRKVLTDYQISSRIKWPNDLLVGEEKICGILVEGTYKGKVGWAIVGIGLNINMEDEILRTIDRKATSMRRVLSSPLSVAEVTKKTCNALLSALSTASRHPDQCLKEFLKACSWMKGMQATVHTPTETLKGTVQGFTLDGHLLLHLPTGKTIAIAQGVID